ncbi:hypothetical protein O9929_02640 [Vibrio lentus]|nr:hypothetical protein [Vibrio lentus]
MRLTQTTQLSQQCWRLALFTTTLIRKGLRAKCDIVVETGDARETHHCNLNRLRCNAVNPYLVIETIVELQRTKKLADPNAHPRELFDNYRKGVNVAVY